MTAILPFGCFGYSGDGGGGYRCRIEPLKERKRAITGTYRLEQPDDDVLDENIEEIKDSDNPVFGR